MPDFSKRSEMPEMIDSHVGEKLLFRNLAELDFLNRYFGGHSASIRGIRSLISPNKREYSMLDFGCGSGDTMKQVALWGRKANIKIRLTGVDVSREAIRHAKAHCSAFPEITVTEADYRQFMNERFGADIFHCSLFCHHLPDNELESLLAYFTTCSTAGFVINDVLRKPLGYYGSKILTRLAGGTLLARNDGPLSVLKGLTKKEWTDRLQKAGVRFRISEIWFYRILITGYVGI